MKCQILVYVKIKKNISKCQLLKVWPSRSIDLNGLFINMPNLFNHGLSYQLIYSIITALAFEK